MAGPTSRPGPSGAGQDARMETQSNEPLHSLDWVADLALIVICGAGFAALMGWIPTSIG